MERRYTDKVELRENENGSVTVTGYAAVYFRDGTEGTEYELWDGARERIVPGAFDRALNEGHDVRALLNHDPNMLLGRTKSGTLKLSTNRGGLQYEIDLPDTTVGRDVRTSLERGDLSGSSFAFRVTSEKWGSDESGEIRELHDMDLLDVSVVTYPAYKATTAGMRDEDLAECRNSHDQWKSAELEAIEAEHEQLELQIRLKEIDA